MRPESRNHEPYSVAHEFMRNMLSSNAECFGMVMNSFHELEPEFVDYLKETENKPYYSVGPLCMVEAKNQGIIMLVKKDQEKRRGWSG